MAGNETIPITLTASRLDDFCWTLRRRTSDPALAVQLLSNLQTFISHAVTDAVHPAWQQARRRLDAHIEAERGALLELHAKRLVGALRDCDGEEPVRSFMTLSRSGFSDAAARAWRRLCEPDHRAARDWLDQWLDSARERATAAGRYPDAPDFHGAGISIELYLAMDALRAVATDC